MAIPQQNVKRLLAYSGIAHIGYMLIGFAAVSANGVAMMLFYLVAYLFGNMGAFLVVEAVAQSEGSERIDAYKGLAQRSPVLALAMLLFLLSLGRHSRSWPASGPSSTCSGPPPRRGSTGWCSWARCSRWSRSSTTSWWPRGCTSTPPSVPGPSSVSPLLALAILICSLGVVIMGIYPKPFVLSALRVAATLF